MGFFFAFGILRLLHLPLYGSLDKWTLKTFVLVSCLKLVNHEFDSERIIEYHGGGSCPPFVGHTYVPDL